MISQTKMSILTIATWCVLVGSANIAAAGTDLERAIVDVFKRNKCDACHVPVAERAKDPQTGKLLYPAHRDLSYILDLERLRASKYLVPGDPARSPLYKLIDEEKMPEGAEFCFDPSCPYPPVPESDRVIVEKWIESLQ